jgi:hypothetical protein
MVDTSGGPDACHPWTGARNEHGYGQFWDGTYHANGSPRMVGAHRWGYRRFVGDPGRLHVRHTCDQPWCQNRRHWVLGTHLQNMADRSERGRCVLPDARGTRNGHAKITEDVVRDIRRRAAAGELHREIAADVGLSRSSVGLIVNRVNWPHVA